MPTLEAFGERKSPIEWARDPRCVVKYGTLINRIADGWDIEEAITLTAERRERNYVRPPMIITAFGESMSVNEWKNDPRVQVKSNVFVRRIQHGWNPEAAITTPLSINRGRKEGNGPVYEVFGETKSIREWALDERCAVSEMTLRKNIQSGMPLLEAFQFRRRPGRNLGPGKEDLGRQVEDHRFVQKMMQEGGELWVYDTGGTRRISLIHNDIRHTISDDIFDVMNELRLISLVFKTDTIQNFELTPVGKEVQ